MEKYLSLEFFIVIASIILIIALPKILIKISRRSKVGFIISIVIVGVILISLIVYFTHAYNIRHSFEGMHHIYGRIIRIDSKNEFIVNSTKGTYEAGSVGYIKIKIDKNTALYSSNIFEKIDTVKVGDLVTIVCSNEQIENSQLNALRVIKEN